MAVTPEMEEAMMARYEAMKEEGSPLEKLRAHVMSKGVKGIRTISRIFKRIDYAGDRKIHFHEFWDALQDYNIDMDKNAARECFDEMDLDGAGVVNFDEFLIALRPPLSDARKELIDQAFQKFDADGDGMVTTADLRGVYSAEFHPKFQSGEWTEEQVFQNWIDNFTEQDGDYEISTDDFFNYYVGVSSSIDDDEYFVEMMKSAWKLE